MSNKDFILKNAYEVVYNYYSNFFGERFVEGMIYFFNSSGKEIGYYNRLLNVWIKHDVPREWDLSILEGYGNIEPIDVYAKRNNLVI